MIIICDIYFPFTSLIDSKSTYILFPGLGQENLLAGILIFFLVLSNDNNKVDATSWDELKQKGRKYILGINLVFV